VEENRLSTPSSAVDDRLWGLVGAVLFLFRRARSNAVINAVMMTPAKRHPIASPAARPVESPFELPVPDVVELLLELVEVCCVDVGSS
jgi:hypothetical protein